MSIGGSGGCEPATFILTNLPRRRNRRRRHSSRRSLRPLPQHHSSPLHPRHSPHSQSPLRRYSPAALQWLPRRSHRRCRRYCSRMSPQPAGSHSPPRRRVLPQQGRAGGRRQGPGRAGGRRQGPGRAGERRAGPGQAGGRRQGPGRAGTLLPVRGRCSAESGALVWSLNSMSADPSIQPFRNTQHVQALQTKIRTFVAEIGSRVWTYNNN
jgi:hypothetical protein